MNTIYLATAVQATLYAVELTGQISDGHWENSSPQNHWKDPCRAKVKVDPVNPRIEGFRPLRTYGFTSPLLLECVGHHMLMFARARIKYPTLSDDAINALESGDWFWTQTDEHYKKIQSEFAGLGINDYGEMRGLKDGLLDVKYDTKDLKKDLRAIGQVFKQAYTA
jgi:hypothetical protein